MADRAFRSMKVELPFRYHELNSHKLLLTVTVCCIYIRSRFALVFVTTCSFVCMCDGEGDVLSAEAVDSMPSVVPP